MWGEACVAGGKQDCCGHQEAVGGPALPEEMAGEAGRGRPSLWRPFPGNVVGKGEEMGRSWRVMWEEQRSHFLGQET